MSENNEQRPQQTVSQFCYNLATVLDAAIIERNKELIETAMGHAKDLTNLQKQVLAFAEKLAARDRSMGEAHDNVLQKYIDFFGIQQEQKATITGEMVSEPVIP